MRPISRVPPLAMLLIAGGAAPLRAQEEKARVADPARKEVDALQTEFGKALRDADGKENSKRSRIETARRFLPRFQALAEGHAGTDAGLRAVRNVFIIHGITEDLSAWQTTLDAALRAPSNHKGYADFVHWFRGNDRAPWLRGTLEASANPEVKAAVLVALGEIHWDGGRAAAEEVEKARSAFEEVERRFPDTAAAEDAKGFLYETRHLAVGMRAPEISFTDQQGNTRRLSEFRGRVVLLQFWVSWLPECRAEMPVLKRLHDRFGQKGLAVIGFAACDTREVVARTVEGLGLNYLIAHDAREPTSTRAYNIRETPSSWLIDRDGTIRARGRALAEIEKKIAELLGDGAKPAPAAGLKSGQ